MKELMQISGNLYEDDNFIINSDLEFINKENGEIIGFEDFKLVPDPIKAEYAGLFKSFVESNMDHADKQMKLWQTRKDAYNKTLTDFKNLYAGLLEHGNGHKGKNYTVYLRQTEKQYPIEEELTPEDYDYEITTEKIGLQHHLVVAKLLQNLMIKSKVKQTPIKDLPEGKATKSITNTVVIKEK